MKFRNLLILGLVLVGFSYCSNDDDTTLGVDENEKSGVQMQLVVNMPSSANTRSKTGDILAEEKGTAEENAAKAVLISIFDASGKYIASYRPDLETGITAGNKVSYKTTVFQANDLKIGVAYKVYVYLNPYNQMDIKAQNPNEFFKPWDKALSEEARFESAMNGYTGVVNGFFMSNASTVAAKTVESTATTIASPFLIEANVERAVARFDYTAKNATNEYTVDVSDVKVIFTDYKIINRSKEFYHLRRVNTDGVGIYGGVETVENYVMDTDWEAKKLDAAGWATNWASNFYFYLKSDNVSAYTKLPTAIAANPLSYVTENTIPSVNASKKGLSTAVVFKGKLDYTEATYGGGVGLDVYVWNNKFYGTFDKLPAGVRSLVGSSVADRTTANLVNAGVTSYSWDTTIEGGGGYPVYYVYYNRHNNNGVATTTGPMEYAVVRNNVYKLSINGVKLFGHSNDPQIKNPTNADPNPELPEDDLERDNLYMEVNATVLPWTVRVNNIEF